MNSKLYKEEKQIWHRLLEVLRAENLDQAAQELHMNASTLRGRKARNALPYDKIVHKLNGKQLVYVFKNEEVENLQKTNGERVVYRRTNEELQQKIKEKSKKYSEELQIGKMKPDFETRLISLINRVKNAPFSNSTKLKVIDSIIAINEKKSYQAKQT
jgi:hypothetical protein